MLEDNQIFFGLRSIQTEQFATFEDNLNSQKIAEVKSQYQFKLNAAEQQLGFFMHFEFVQNDKPILKLVVSVHYAIEQKAWNEFIDGEQVSFPKKLIYHMMMVGIGAARGILAAKTEHSPFSRFILPFIDVTKIISEDLQFELKK